MIFNHLDDHLADRVGRGVTAHLLQCSHSHCSLEDCIKLLHVLCNSHLPRKIEHGCSTEGGRQGDADAWGRACNATFPDGQHHSQRQNDQGQHLKACWHLQAVSVLLAVCLLRGCQYLWQGNAAAWGASLQCYLLRWTVPLPASERPGTAPQSLLAPACSFCSISRVHFGEMPVFVAGPCSCLGASLQCYLPRWTVPLPTSE